MTSARIIAHRGARSLAPENTRAAATAARHLGAHAWETDVQVTRDGQVHPSALAGFKNEKIPTLAQGLELTRSLDWQVNLELKDHGTDPDPFYTVDITLAKIAGAGILPPRSLCPLSTMPGWTGSGSSGPISLSMPWWEHLRQTWPGFSPAPLMSTTSMPIWWIRDLSPGWCTKDSRSTCSQ